MDRTFHSEQQAKNPHICGTPNDMQTSRTTNLVLMICTTAILSVCAPAPAQNPACPAGYRVLARRYDAELRKTWEMRQSCLHPEWPARSAAIVSNSTLLAGNSTSLPLVAVSNIQPVLVHAGEAVRLWSQDATSRIEIGGIAEQSARAGERINVRVSHQTDDSGITMQHIAGIVRATDNVEIAQ
jgi:hypothetical protein